MNPMAKRIDLFRASAPKMFASSLIYFGLCLFSLSAVFMVVGSPKVNNPAWLLLFAPAIPLTGYMAIGAFINACRRTRNWFVLFFGWKDSCKH